MNEEPTWDEFVELVRDGQVRHPGGRFEELCRLAREEPLFPGQADAGLDDRFRVVPASDDPGLSPDAARWTPEDETWHAS